MKILEDFMYPKKRSTIISIYIELMIHKDGIFLQVSVRYFSPLSVIVLHLPAWSNLEWIFAYLHKFRWILFKVWRCFQLSPRYFSPLSLLYGENSISNPTETNLQICI